MDLLFRLPLLFLLTSLLIAQPLHAENKSTSVPHDAESSQVPVIKSNTASTEIKGFAGPSQVNNMSKENMYAVIMNLLFNDRDGPFSESFSKGSVTLNASTTNLGYAKKSIVKNINSGQTIATCTVTTIGVSLSFSGVNGTTEIDFPTSLSELPSDFSVNRLCVYIAGPLSEEPSFQAHDLPIDKPADSPGCDWFPDTQCTLSCCSSHDECFSEHDCSVISWLPDLWRDACDDCNQEVAACIMLACGGAIGTEGDRCYDNRCNQHYDCGDTSCTCESPCDKKSYHLYKRGGIGYRKRWGGWSEQRNGYDYSYAYVTPLEHQEIINNYSQSISDATASACANGPPICPCPPYPDIWAAATIKLIGTFDTVEELEPYRCDNPHNSGYTLICNMWNVTSEPYPGFWPAIDQICQ